MSFLSVLNNKYNSYFHYKCKYETEAKAKNDWVAKEALKSLASAGTAIFLSNYSFNSSIKLLNWTGLCPSSLFPKGTTEFFDKYINYPNLLCGGTRGFGCSHFVRIFTGPLFEELVDRILLQELLLKKAPKTILKKYSPNHAHLVDHIAVRIARVFTSSVFFALHHSWAHTCSNGDMYPYITAGIAFGTLQEISGHPLHNLIAHFATNYLIFNS